MPEIISLASKIRYSFLPTLIIFSGLFPGGSDSKESACNARDLGLIPGL